MKQILTKKAVFDPVLFERVLRGERVSGFTRSSLVLFIFQSFLKKPAFFLFDNNQIAFEFYTCLGFEKSASVFYYPEKSKNKNVPGFISNNERYRQETIYQA